LLNMTICSVIPSVARELSLRQASERRTDGEQNADDFKYK